MSEDSRADERSEAAEDAPDDASSETTSAVADSSADSNPGDDGAGSSTTTEPTDGGRTARRLGDSNSLLARRRRLRAAKRRNRKPKRKAPWWELPGLVLLAIVIAILVKSFVVQPFYIPSQSMEKTLHGCPSCHGDRILVNKPIYDFRDPHPGDIVVFHAPRGWSEPGTSKPPGNPVLRLVRGFGQLIGFVPPDGQVLVKRVIADGGQTVKGTASGEVMISNSGANGPWRTLHEPYKYIDPDDGQMPAFGPVTVPKGRLWVMGDHRSNSADSRYHCTPGGGESTSNDSDCDPESSTVPDGDVIGKAFVIAWPPSRWRTLGTPSTFESTASAAGPALPGVASVATVLPALAVRRRRRRRSVHR
ncbi:signal peptidase I [uncultured Jatrophihabitans sp.]|uniref:signal peptidase I n=1 Tax=uncultured Jatrophihabitans sp. TaxID=1610747 RepID=UPI0035CBE9B3